MVQAHTISFVCLLVLAAFVSLSSPQPISRTTRSKRPISVNEVKELARQEIEDHDNLQLQCDNDHFWQGKKCVHCDEICGIIDRHCTAKCSDYINRIRMEESKGDNNWMAPAAFCISVFLAFVFLVVGIYKFVRWMRRKEKDKVPGIEEPCTSVDSSNSSLASSEASEAGIPLLPVNVAGPFSANTTTGRGNTNETLITSVTNTPVPLRSPPVVRNPESDGSTMAGSLLEIRQVEQRDP